MNREIDQSDRIGYREPPDQARLTAIQATRLSKLTNIDAKRFQGLTVGEAAERFKWEILPEFFFFERICGRVVKTDPNTGIDYPVPRATVHVEDTDCSFLGFFPVESPFSWLFPIFCHREEIGTVQTDDCGKFCVWVPRFDIDWILRFRRERVCYLDFLVKPSVRDLLDRIKPHVHEQPVIGPHGPGPDPGPMRLKARGIMVDEIKALAGSDVAKRISVAESAAAFGGRAEQSEDVLDRRAFPTPLPPPLSHHLRELHHKEGAQGILKHLGVAASRTERLKLDLHYYIGPLLRCYDVFVPEFVPILDVPDITFRVTQDVNGDGTEETIYSEGFLDVRWNSGPISDVTLHASQIAVAGLTCDSPEVACESPDIVMAGLMPLHNLTTPPGVDPYLDSNTGYARRPNRPHPSGLIAEVPPPHTLATAPFTGTLQLYGCNHRPGASFYRILYTFQAPGSGNVSSVVPFVNLSWSLWRWIGTPGHLEIHSVASDSLGWYPILPESDGWMPAHLLLNWPTAQAGLYKVQMEFADGGKNVIAGSATSPIGIYVDNTVPTSIINEIRWRVAGTGTWSAPIPRVCPVIHRGGQDIEFRINYTGSSLHLLYLQLYGSGCGGGNPQRVPDSPQHNWSDPPSSVNPYEHWHTGQFDNSVSRTAIFTLSHTAPQGAYDFELDVYSRAFNPSGGDGGFEADWYYNYPHPTGNSDVWKIAIIDS